MPSDRHSGIQGSGKGAPKRGYCAFRRTPFRRLSRPWRAISSRGRLDIAGVPQTRSAFCLHAYSVNLMQFLGRSSSTISGEHLPPSGELLARWSSQGEEHAHAVRKRVRSWGVGRTKLYAFDAHAALKHRALGPCRLAEFFLSSYGRYPEVSEAGTAARN